MAVHAGEKIQHKRTYEGKKTSVEKSTNYEQYKENVWVTSVHRPKTESLPGLDEIDHII